MATAKKAAVKKSAAVKKTAAKKSVTKKSVVKRKVEQAELPLEAQPKTVPGDALEKASAEPPKRRGRPAGSTSRRGKKGKAGRKAAQEFLYSIRKIEASDDLGLDADEPKAQTLNYVGPFASEQEATKAALADIQGADGDYAIILFRDFRRGKPETKVRLVG